MAAVTDTKTRRLVYFIGHPQQSKSALICQITKYYETFSKIFTGESATRTLLNIYNLHAVRGKLNHVGELIFDTSMSGPHHYYGFLDPRKSHTIEFEGHTPIYHEYPFTAPVYTPKLSPGTNIVCISYYNWINGLSVTDAKRKEYGMEANNPRKLLSTSSHKIIEKDSLFDNPGILETSLSTIVFSVITDAYNYDLSSFRAQVVQNNQPFSFNQNLVSVHKHAQHRLRVVTYNYGDNYVDGYLMPGNGIFIERHEFIQAITPTSPACGGYVILGRESEKGLELIAVTIPFGHTLLIDSGAIHGDSTLTGLYSMAMTGNHKAMATADTVFMKSSATKKNVAVSTDKPTVVHGLPGTAFHLSSDAVSQSDLYLKDYVLKDKIKKTLSFLETFYFQPVILTGTSIIGWDRTHGISLP